MAKVLITCMHLARNFETLHPQYTALGVEAIVPSLDGQQFSAAQMSQLIVGMDAVIAGDDTIDAAVLDAGQASHLKAVIKWGIGTDGIDKVHAKSTGIPVYNTPGVFGDEVADLAIAHLLMLTRKSHLLDRSVREGGWLKVEGHSLAGLTAGIVGLGSIGQAIARRAHAFGMRVVGYDVAPPEISNLSQQAITLASFEDVLAAADVVFLACALTPDNVNLMGPKAFALMKPGALLINVSRGLLVDEAALFEALTSGSLAGAGLDVFEQEPLPLDSPLRAVADRCTFSTHNGSNTHEAVARINQMTTDILFDVLGLKRAGFIPNRVA